MINFKIEIFEFWNYTAIQSFIQDISRKKFWENRRTKSAMYGIFMRNINLLNNSFLYRKGKKYVSYNFNKTPKFLLFHSKKIINGKH